jgi:hypothetical protein
MMTAVQAFGWCHQYSIADLLIARDMGCELITSGLDASRFAPVIRFGQSFHLGIHAHIHSLIVAVLVRWQRGNRKLGLT